MKKGNASIDTTGNSNTKLRFNFITPIPARGRLGIFPLEASIADQVEEERRRVLQAAHEVDAALKRAVGN